MYKRHLSTSAFYLSSIHNCAHPNSESHGGDFRQVVSKEASIGYYSVLGQCLHSRPRHQTGTGLIEGNVAIWSNSCNEHS